MKPMIWKMTASVELEIKADTEEEARDVLCDSVEGIKADTIEVAGLYQECEEIE